MEVAASYPQFRYAVPLVAPVGKMDLTQYTGAVRAEDAAGQGTVKILDLDNIDDILADILTDDSLGEDLWDSET